jgi:hypothetical protein
MTQPSTWGPTQRTEMDRCFITQESHPYSRACGFSRGSVKCNKGYVSIDQERDSEVIL